MKTIPVIHCFDSNYVLPAAVCFRSMLEHADTANFRHAIHVVGDIGRDGRKILDSVVSGFKNATLEFHAPPPLPVDPATIPSTGHYSADLYNKLLIPNLFPQYDIAVVADVDVVYQDDIAKAFNALEPGKLVAGVYDLGYAAWHREGLFPTGRPLIKKYLRTYTREELDDLRIGAGLLVYDLKGLRDGGWPAKWTAFAKRNAHRAILPEQEVINLTLGDKIQLLPLGFMAVAEHAAAYDRMTDWQRRANPAWDEMYAAPIQMHYASKIKPWKYPGSSRAELWFDACTRAGVVETWRKWYAEFSRPMVEDSLAKTVLNVQTGRFTLKLLKRRRHNGV